MRVRMHNEFLKPLFLDYEVCLGWMFMFYLDLSFIYSSHLLTLKKSLIAMCNVNIFNMLCFRTCGSECKMTKVGDAMRLTNLTL